MAAEREKIDFVEFIEALATLNVVPIPSSATIKSNGPAALWRRKREIFFTSCLTPLLN